MSNEANVYIATLPRSGSTLLGMMLDAHSQIFHVGESSYWGKINPRDVTCSCGVIGCALLQRAYELMRNHQSVFDIYRYCSYIDRFEEPNKFCHQFSLPNNELFTILSPQDEDRLLYSCCLGHIRVADVFRQITKKGVIVDNTKNIRIAKALVTNYDWKVILLTRDPRGVVNSSKKAGIRKGVPRPVGTKIPVLASFVRQAACLMDYSQVLHVKYEDLCSNPKSTLSLVCRFIGVEFEAKMIDFRQGRGHTLMGNRMRLDPSNNTVRLDESWKRELSLEEVSLISNNPELEKLYRKLGYTLKE